jgi:hypothetical protein
MVTTVRSRSLSLPVALAALTLAASLGAARPAAADVAYVVSATNIPFTIDTATPTAEISHNVPRFLQPGETIVGIDLRPATGQVYAVGTTSRVYVLDPAIGSYTLVGTGPFTPALSGTAFGVDFDPVTDRLRVVSNTGQNLRLNPDTGTVAAVDTPFAPSVRLAALAYAQNVAGSTVSPLFGIDAATDQLVLVSAPNAGTVTPIGPLGVDTSDDVHFDITANDNTAYAALTVGGLMRLYTINLATGAATLAGGLFGGPHAGFTVLGRGVPMIALRNGTELAFFHSATPGTIQRTLTVTGLQDGETLRGLDRRPANGQLYAVGTSDRLYRIDPITGTATAAGAPLGVTPSGFLGIDFDPRSDRLRVVTSTQEDLTVDPDTGVASPSTLPIAIDAAGAAFNSNVDATPFTTLFLIDAQFDRVTSQDQLGDGTLVPLGSLGVDTTFDVGFDISPLDGIGFAALRVGGSSGLYKIDLTTGAARLIGPIGTGATVSGLVAMPVEYQLAEGSTGAFFDTDILLANPTSSPVPVTVSFMTELAKVVTEGRLLPPQSRTTISADANALLGQTAFSTTVASHLGVPIAVERTMRWDPTGYGMHGEKAADNLARTWYFAEGAQGFYDTFFLLTNPGTGPNAVQLRFLLENGNEVVVDELLLGQSRLTIYAGNIPELVNQSFGTVVTFSSAGAAERAMYFGQPTFNGGHESAGVTDPATDWFLAEGATGSFFTTFVLLSNPNATPAQVTMTYLREGGGSVVRAKTLAPHSRLTINVALEDPALAATSVATRAASDVPIVVERAMYWPQTPASWNEASNAFGVTKTARKWGFAEGRVGGPSAYQSFFLVANPGTLPAQVTMTLLRTSGAPIVKTFTVAAGARFTITTGPGSAVPELADEAFGATITSDQPVVAERAMYSNSSTGVFWAAGSAATAAELPLP